MTANNPVPARLFVLLAREAQVGVIIRRGPTDWVQLIHWDTRKDIFTPGQWFHGKVYEERCDLSPDGSLLIYFASKYSRARIQDMKAVWTAISKPPYFTALKIWFQDSTWGGGGLFEDQNRIWLRAPGHGEPEILRPELKFQKARPKADKIVENPIAYHGVYYYRLERDDWTVIERVNAKYAIPRKWQKQVGDILLEQEYGGHSSRLGGTWFHYAIVIDPEHRIGLDAKWADFDYRGRLVLARDGKIFSAKVRKGELVLTELADFNANQHEPMETPDWAAKW